MIVSSHQYDSNDCDGRRNSCKLLEDSSSLFEVDMHQNIYCQSSIYSTVEAKHKVADGIIRMIQLEEE